MPLFSKRIVGRGSHPYPVQTRPSRPPIARAAHLWGAGGAGRRNWARCNPSAPVALGPALGATWLSDKVILWHCRSVARQFAVYWLRVNPRIMTAQLKFSARRRLAQLSQTARRRAPGATWLARREDPGNGGPRASRAHIGSYEATATLGNGATSPRGSTAPCNPLSQRRSARCTRAQVSSGRNAGRSCKD